MTVTLFLWPSPQSISPVCYRFGFRSAWSFKKGTFKAERDGVSAAIDVELMEAILFFIVFERQGNSNHGHIIETFSVMSRKKLLLLCSMSHAFYFLGTA